MPENKFLNEKADKKKRAGKAVWLLLFFSAIAIAMVVKIAVTGSLKPDFHKGLPSREEAYEIAKEFVRPTLKSPSVNFSDEGFQAGKTSDSVYVIKSSLETEGTTMDFKITLQYKGGEPNKQKNWSVIDLSNY
ncbi:hypothetical protein [Mucilaginibacter auburnensis]|uniref:Uncharacterized protein n=1 Tax=Mucilaginibacter auburnensis TaxID=1457233 RepID=A0A2H9VVJ9_9SPHI|nr:hypothetical protein [Mucilaginibacter auburnensis]PJJ84863.1 hypothetical protein CLV57_1885 [Mucilaginibacter auburnensis]